MIDGKDRYVFQIDIMTLYNFMLGLTSSNAPHHLIHIS